MLLPTSPSAEIESARGERIPTILNSTCKLNFELAGHVFLIDCLDDWSASAVSPLVNSWLVDPVSFYSKPDYIHQQYEADHQCHEDGGRFQAA